MAGSLGLIVTMAIHPTSAASLSAYQLAHLSTLSGIAHSLAMVSVLVLFLGACGLAQRTAAADRFSFAGIVTFGFACVAVIIAAAVSGFVVPSIMNRMSGDVPEAAHQWRIVIYGIFQINQAFAAIYSVGISLAIILWSISALRNGGLGRGMAIYGCVIAPLIIVGIAARHVRFDVHGMMAVGLGQVVWFMIAGYQLTREPFLATARARPHESA